ncbi:MAG: cysteate synthase [Rikenellaceae bacterium]|jgi:cysteate synthase|nr:cysteate synthase [Rikenellaceae bacterium]
MEPITPTRYQLENVATGRIFPDEGWTLEDPQGGEPALVRAVYEKRQLEVKDMACGIYRFADWLPVSRMLRGSASPVTYKSTNLSEHLGLKNLWITFNGYFPERGAAMTSCSFKETEAYAVGGRLDPACGKVLVVASAGNTARAFAKVCSENQIPLLLCVPEDNLDALWFERSLNDCVKLIAAQSGGDYFDAIHLSNLALRSSRFLAEGGAKNIARRDGMGTTFLSATTTIGRIPDYYFQAVGSGTGAIAAWEANLRLIADGRFGSHTARLMVSQNAPFLPMHHAWRAGSRTMLPYDDNLARTHVEEIDAKVLSNRKPPYSIVGGMYDAVKATRGDVLYATNDEARQAAALFERLEGVDIHSAPAVAVATLLKTVANGEVERDAVIMLNITGGGEGLFKSGKSLSYLKPAHVFGLEPDADEVVRIAESLF